MSYILDALRRAESERERERNQVPGLNAQTEALADAEADTVRRAGPGGRLWIGVALLVGVAATLAWWLGRAGGGEVRPDAAVIAAPPQALPRPAPGAATVRAPDAVAVPIAPAPAAAPMPGLPSGPAQSAPRSAEPRPAKPNAPVVTPMPPTQPAAPTARNAVAAPPSIASGVRADPTGGASSAVPRTVTLAELSAEQRSALPSMAIGGAIYSEQAASRFILVNGQVVREGEAAAPGVKLERIGPKAAMLRWRDLRIEVPY